jgi:hypothetical protein
VLNHIDSNCPLGTSLAFMHVKIRVEKQKDVPEPFYTGKEWKNE